MSNVFKFLGLTPVLWAAQALTFPLAPIAAKAADPHGRLPKWARWMETYDNLGWKGPLSEPATRKLMYNRSKALTRWLWRNKCYTLRRKWGVDGYFTAANIETNGIKQRPKWGPSLYVVKLRTTTGSYFEYQPSVGLGVICLYFRIGWKLSGLKQAMLNNRPINNKLIFTGITPRVDDYDG